jgi:hypothetical protein
MSKNISISEIYDLVGDLQSKNPKERQIAKYKLSAIGKPAAPALLQFAHNPDTELRHDVIELLGNIEEVSAIPVLIDALEDASFEVRWRASESLVKMKREAVVPLLKELRKKERFSSQYFLEGAHHVFRRLHEYGYIGPSAKILDAFDEISTDVAIPTSANEIIQMLGE